MEQPRGIQWTLVQKLEEQDFTDNVSLLPYRIGHLQEYANKCKPPSLLMAS